MEQRATKKNSLKKINLISRNIKRQKGAILVMSIFLIIVFISLAALFVDGFRLYETKQEIDSYSEYVVESLNKKLTEVLSPCMNTCETSYTNCTNKCTDDDKNTCTNYCQSTRNDCKSGCYKNLDNSDYDSFSKFITHMDKNTDKALEENPNLGAIIKKDEIKYECFPPVQLKTDDTGHSVQCTLNFSIEKSDFIFAGIFGEEATQGELEVTICKKSCYKASLKDYNIYPYYFEDCNSDSDC